LQKLNNNIVREETQLIQISHNHELNLNEQQCQKQPHIKNEVKG